MSGLEEAIPPRPLIGLSVVGLCGRALCDGSGSLEGTAANVSTVG